MYLRKRVAHLCDRSGGPSIPDHNPMGNKLRNFFEIESGWASISDHPSGRNWKKIQGRN